MSGAAGGALQTGQRIGSSLGAALLVTVYELTNAGLVTQERAGRNLIVSSHANSPDLMRVTVKPSVMERLRKREGAVVAYESVDGIEVLGA